MRYTCLQRQFSTSSTLFRGRRSSRRELMDKKKLLQDFRKFLGPRNITGDYYKNKYFYAPQNNKPNYIVPDGMPVVGEGKIPRIMPQYNKFQPSSYRDPNLHPFPQNTLTKTAYMIPEYLKLQIVEDATIRELHPQEIAHKYGLNIQRVEAILKLDSIRKQFTPKETIKNDLKKFADVMGRLFPLFKVDKTADNLTEIPTPHKTLTDRFVTIEENQPFGPVDAAKVLNLEPAAKTLKALTEFNLEEAQKQQQIIESKKVDVLYGKRRENDKKLFRFTMKKVGEFGHRYGASRRDTKLDRGVGFDASGKMVYLHPDQ